MSAAGNEAISASGAKRHTLAAYLRPRTLVMLALGFSSGLPFLLVGNTFGYWLRDEGTTLTAIGVISWVGIAYSLQFLWAPILDRVPSLKFLGQRRGWMVLSQIFVAAGLFGMAFVGAGLILASRAQTILQVYAAYSVGIGVGVGSAYVPAVAVVQRWFVKRRGLASGLAVSGIGVATSWA